MQMWPGRRVNAPGPGTEVEAFDARETVSVWSGRLVAGSQRVRFSVPGPRKRT